MGTILVANVYVYSLEKWMLRQSLLPCYEKLKNVKFTKRIGAATKYLSICKIHFLLEAIYLNTFLQLLEEPLCEETNKLKFSLSLDIRLEYRLLYQNQYFHIYKR